MLRIRSIEYYLPGEAVTNRSIEEENSSWPIDKISEKTGVLNRYVAPADETALDLSVIACQQLLNKSYVPKEKIDGICFCTQTPDYVMPPNSFLLQAKLDLRQHIFAFDINHGCTGYIYSLVLASGLLSQKTVNHILIVNSDTYSKIINKRDRSARLLFGDGAAVTLVDRDSGGGSKLVDVVFRSLGQRGDSFMVPAGGQKLPSSPETRKEFTDADGNVRSDENIVMRGFEVWGILNSIVPPMISDLLLRNELEKSDIDLWFFHQSSKMTLNSLVGAIGIEEYKVFSNIENIGNTVSASIPILMRDAMSQGVLQRGQKVILCGFGVGMSAGAILLQF